ncbi:MAG: pantetheine-phosphate adenylyltransferase [Clostridia bacterium]|nr:pantetheine-phosphate adenylyltransferase [Clostridia bacterium]
MKVILPGSYDPVTLGHLDLIRRAREQYGEVYAVVFVNPNKKYMFSPEERAEMLSLACADMDGISVDFSDGLVIDYMKQHGIEKIVKGFRNDFDLEWERVQAEYNFSHGGYSTELYRCNDGLADLSSTLARDRILSGEVLDGLLHPAVIKYIKNKK